MFEFTKLNATGIARAEQIAGIFEQVVEKLTQVVGVPEGRELTIVKTKLEEACFFAKKAISRQSENQG